MKEWTLIDSIKYKRKVYNIYKRTEGNVIGTKPLPTCYKIKTRDADCSVMDTRCVFFDRIQLCNFIVHNQTRYMNTASDMLEFVELFVNDKISKSAIIEHVLCLEDKNQLAHLCIEKGYHAKWTMSRGCSYTYLSKRI